MSVVSVVDDQTITVYPAMLTEHAVGELVYPVAGSALTAAAAKGKATLQVSDPGVFLKGDLVSVEGAGFSEIRVVTAAPAASTIQLGVPLESPYSAGAVVRKYTAALTVSAYSPGAWGNRIRLTIKPLDSGDAVTRFSMLATVDQGGDPSQPLQQEFYPFLSLDPNDPYPTPIYAPDVVNAASQLIRVKVPPPPQVLMRGMRLLVNNGPLQTGDLYLEGGSDGTPGTAAPASTAPISNPCVAPVAATPAASPSFSSQPLACDQDFYDALEVLGLVDEVGILCCPDAAGPPPPIPMTAGWSMTEIQKAMVNQCVQQQYRVAVLDTPMSLAPAQALQWLQQQAWTEPAARFAAAYYPWLKCPDEADA